MPGWGADVFALLPQNLQLWRGSDKEVSLVTKWVATGVDPVPVTSQLAL